MNVRQFTIAAGAAVILLGGCATQEQTGQLTGAVAGGLLGNAVGGDVGAIVGAAGGFFVGGAIGRNMDNNDRARANAALESSSTGQSTSWTNPDNRTHYRVTPTRTYKRDGVDCRDYTTMSEVNGRPEYVHGTACRRNGEWVAL